MRHFYREDICQFCEGIQENECSFCGKEGCIECVSPCAICGYYFCPNCSQMNYDQRIERKLCINCFADLARQKRSAFNSTNI